MDRSAHAALRMAESITTPSGPHPASSMVMPSGSSPVTAATPALPHATHASHSPQLENGSSASASSSERLRSVLQFEDWFWGNGDGDPTVGVKALYDVISKHLCEIDEVVIAIKQRVAIEEGYAMRIAEYAKVLQTFTLASGFVGASSTAGFANAVPYGGIQGIGSGATWGGQGLDLTGAGTFSDAQALESASARRKSGTATNGGLSELAATGTSLGSSSASATSSHSATSSDDSHHAATSGLYHSLDKPGGGATADDESSLLPVVRSWGRILQEMTACNRRHADTLMMAALTPLQGFVAQHRRVLEKKRAEVDSHHRTVTKLQTDIAQKRTAYVQRCKYADTAAEQHRRGAGIDDEALARSRRDADAAMREYQQAITAAEHSRSALEFQITDFLLWAQETEHYRLRVAREAFLALESAQLFTVEAHTRLWTVDVDPELAHGGGNNSSGYAPSSSAASSSGENGGQPLLRLLTPSPSRGVENIAMRLRTGSRHSPAFVFEPYVPALSLPPPPSASDDLDDDATLQPPKSVTALLPEAAAAALAIDAKLATPRQAFGISLDDLFRATGDPIPAVVRKCVASLAESKVKGRLRSGIDAWIMPNPDLPSVHFLRLEFNAGLAGMRVSSARLARETPAVVAGVLKLFLIETPASLCTHEVYDVLKIIYSAPNQEGEEETMIRIKSVSSLLATLTPAHYETLKIFAGLMHDTIKGIDPSDKRLRRLAYSIAPCIIRPKKESSETLADEHPYFLTMDLLLHFAELFGGPLPLSYFEAPPTPPASPDPDADLLMDDMPAPGSGNAGGAPAKRSLGGRLKAASSLNLKEMSGEVGQVAGSAWRGLVKSVSNLNLRTSAASTGAGAAGAAAAAAAGAGQASAGSMSPASANGASPVTDGSAGAGGSWFSWTRGGSTGTPSANPTSSGSPTTRVPPPPPGRQQTLGTIIMEEAVDFEHQLDLDHESEAEEGEGCPCHWAGCSAVLASPEALMEHLKVEHMRAGGAAKKRSSAAVLPVLDVEEEGGRGVVVMEPLAEGEEEEDKGAVAQVAKEE
ncbi:hypothetical protein HDU96_008872 [Phlyctochytrium bullatum]|nr:hypothetical protein HDU96_008872 [Phlyctochytrium bullatum]